MKSVLLIGEDAPLLASRAAVLKHTGATVSYCLPSGFETCARGNAYSIVVLCHTLDADSRRAFTENVHRRWPEGKVLQVSTDFYAQPSRPDLYADAITPATPDTLVRTTMELLGIPAPPKA